MKYGGSITINSIEFFPNLLKMIELSYNCTKFKSKVFFGTSAI